MEYYRSFVPWLLSSNSLNSSFVFFLGRLIVSAMLDWSKCPVVERGPGKARCMWRFKGTHVPATLLFENLEDGATVNDFLEWYPGVTREQVLAVLEFAERSLIDSWGGMPQAQQPEISGKDAAETRPNRSSIGRSI
jgi:uncharacterized protein (DUF433 family)